MCERLARKVLEDDVRKGEVGTPGSLPRGDFARGSSYGAHRNASRWRADASAGRQKAKRS